MDALDQLIVALDFPSQAEAMQMVDRLDGSVRWVKVGLQLYLAEGLSIIETLRARELQVFLDLKLHDIPNTVAGAVRSIGGSGANLLTVHAAGGPAMVAAAVDAAPADLRVLAVTVLTSMDEADLHTVGVAQTVERQAVRLGEMATAAGADGLVCSSAEITALRSSAARDALLVIPGIRSHGAGTDDQRRIASAAEAIRSGADMLVVGRQITRAADPAFAVRHVLAEIAGAKPETVTA